MFVCCLFQCNYSFVQNDECGLVGWLGGGDDVEWEMHFGSEKGEQMSKRRGDWYTDHEDEGRKQVGKET